MTPHIADQQQEDFALAVAGLLRQSRKDQHLTQADIANRTRGIISKAALANYETGHRSLRIDIFWAITKALGEDPGTIIAAAERLIGHSTDTDNGPITIDVAALEASSDPRLAPVRRWFALRVPTTGKGPAPQTVILDPGAIAALAELMGVSHAECRRLLTDIGAATDQHQPPRTASSTPLAPAG